MAKKNHIKQEKQRKTKIVILRETNEVDAFLHYRYDNKKTPVEVWAMVLSMGQKTAQMARKTTAEKLLAAV